MNEFTKEELKEIQDCLSFSCNSKLGFANKLYDKIQFMIDNYCKHENNCQHDWCVGFGSIYSPVVYCKICNCQNPGLTINDFNRVMGINNDNQ